MKQLHKYNNMSFYVVFVVCTVIFFTFFSDYSNAEPHNLNSPPLKVFVPNVADNSGSGKLLLFGANSLRYDAAEEKIYAIGNVNIDDGKTLIIADRLDYTQNNNKVVASGNVTVLSANGVANFVDSFEVEGKAKAGIIEKIKEKMANNPILASIAKQENNYQKFSELEPAAGEDLPALPPINDAEVELKTAPIISLPTVDASPSAPATPQPAATNNPEPAPLIAPVSPIIPTNSPEPAVKLQPTIAQENIVDTKTVADVTPPKSTDVIPDIAKIIDKTLVDKPIEATIPKEMIPINKDVAALSPDAKSSSSSAPKTKGKTKDKKPVVSKATEEKNEKIEKKITSDENVAKDSNAEPTETLSTESRNLLNKIAPTIPVKAINNPSPITVERQRSISSLLNAAESQNNNSVNSAVSAKVENKEQKFNTDYQLERAYNAVNSGQSEVAIEVYKEILETSPNNTQAIFGLATMYHRARQLDKARPLYSKLLAIDPQNRDGFNNFLVLLADEAPREALAELEKLEEKNPGFSTIPAQIAVIYQKLGNLDKATDKMFRAVSLAPENLTYRYNLAVMMDKQKNYDEAAKLYKQLLEAASRGEKIPGNVENLQQRLTFISSNR